MSKAIKPYHSDSMWKGAPGSSFGKAIYLRDNMTNAEKILWEKLRNKNFQNLKFRRQHPISLYIADFYCHELKLIIEIDGGYHSAADQMLSDKERTEVLNFNDIEVIRFTNQQVEHELDSVLLILSEKVTEIKAKG